MVKSFPKAKTHLKFPNLCFIPTLNKPKLHHSQHYTTEHANRFKFYHAEEPFVWLLMEI